MKNLDWGKLRLKSALAATVAVAALSVPLQAQATTFLWSFTGPGVSGGGSLEATFQSGSTYLITSISGTANGQTISGLTGYAGAGQLIFYPQPANVVTDVNGFAFGVGNGSTSYNIYEDYGNIDPSSPYYCGAAPYCIVGPGDTVNGGAGDPVVALTTLTLTAVPEPSTWAMLLVGFAGLGYAGMRRQRIALAA